MSTRSWRRRARRLALHGTLATVSFVMAVPLLWMVVTSFMTSQQIQGPFPQFIPDPPTLENYDEVLGQVPMGTWLMNSTKVTLTVTIGTLLTSSLAGYAFARLRFPGRDVLFLVFLATMMLPFTATVVPLFLFMRDLGWINTHWALIVPSIASPLGVFLFRQYYLTIPRELEDAATIDGANRLTIYARIFVPMSGPVMAAVGMLTVVAVWNSFFWPLLMLNDRDLLTVPVGVAQIRNQLNQFVPRVDLGLIMAGAFISILPVLIIFMIGQRAFVKGVAGIRD